MLAELQLTEKRVRKRIEQLTTLIQVLESELNKELPSFKSLEEDYFKWKEKIDAKLEEIREEKTELDTMKNLSKLEGKKSPRKQIVNSYTGETLQHQVVRQKAGYDSNGLKPLPFVSWVDPIINTLSKEERFMTIQSCYDKMEGVEKNEISRKRFGSAASGKSKYWKTYRIPGTQHAYIGLTEWFDGDTPKAEFLRDFIGKDAVH